MAITKIVTHEAIGVGATKSIDAKVHGCTIEARDHGALIYGSDGKITGIPWTNVAWWVEDGAPTKAVVVNPQRQPERRG